MSAVESEGVWISYYGDMSDVYVHGTEIEALRSAVEGSRLVIFVRWNSSIALALDAKRGQLQ